ncbi:MAG: DUF3853 family protein [Muribaculaceae bacterium]|nr:DUF3853 family protein [Muribaculaceae bacterium]
MIQNLIKGNVGLAEALGVTVRTVVEWKSRGILDPAIVVNYGRIIRYDLEKVKECLSYRPVRPGRRKG